MAAPVFTITQGTTAPALDVTLSDKNGPVNLSTATGIAFDMRNAQDGTQKITGGVCTKIDDGTVGLRGRVSYPWGATDTNTVGTYSTKFTVTWANATTTAFPTDPVSANNYLTVQVVDDAKVVG